MGSLRFDSTAMYNDLEKQAVVIVNNVTYDIFYKMRQGLTGNAKSDNDVFYAKDAYYNHIHSYIANYGYAILQSYGVGTGIDTESEFLSTYKNSVYWNSLRTSNAVVGRVEGEYESVLGSRTSKGTMAGIELNISQKATKVIQDIEEEYFEKGEAIKLISAQMSEWIASNSNRYFKYS